MFMFATHAGSVYFLNDAGKFTKQFTVDSAVRKLLFYDEKQLLLTVTTSMMLSHHHVSPEGNCIEGLKVFFSTSHHP